MCEKIEKIRHSLAHITALAVQSLYPEVKFGIGPAIENGFYYDFDFPQPVGSEELVKIEKEMRKLLKKDIPFEKKEMSKKQAKEIFKNQPYKLELIEGLEQDKVGIYQSGEFADLCKGPHVKSTKDIPSDAFKLDRVAGAYWLGDENNPMLTRVYGLAFNSKKELNEFVKTQEEAEKRDHRKIGKDLGLFIINEEFGKGLPLWLPKGAILRKQVIDFALNTYLKKGYELVNTPHIARLELWERSGHWNFYRDSMYPPMKVENEQFVIKPMNCPGHVKLYNSKIRSYKDLPIRFTEMGTVYRFEKSGELHGLTRVRGFTQDDAHIFCTSKQLSDELVEMINLTFYILKTFGLKEFKITLSVRDPEEKKKYLGSDDTWQLAEKALEQALKKRKLKFKKCIGEAAFYGPKIDILVKDAIGREWQLSTIQVDFNFPEKFNMNYIDNKGNKERPIMLHRALLGSIERFIGVLIEHYAGAFPLWLSPEQIWIIPVGSQHQQYAQEIGNKLEEGGFKTVVKDGAETVSKKIRNGEMQKIPYLLVVGDKEIKEKSVAVRCREKGDVGQMKIEKFVQKAKEQIDNKE